jgi:hypothetical protein
MSLMSRPTRFQTSTADDVITARSNTEREDVCSRLAHDADHRPADDGEDGLIEPEVRISSPGSVAAFPGARVVMTCVQYSAPEEER